MRPPPPRSSARKRESKSAQFSTLVSAGCWCWQTSKKCLKRVGFSAVFTIERTARRRHQVRPSLRLAVAPPRVRRSSPPPPIHSAVLLAPQCATVRCTHTPAVRTGDNRVAHSGHNLCPTVTILMRRAITYESVCWTCDAGLWPPRLFHAHACKCVLFSAK